MDKIILIINIITILVISAWLGLEFNNVDIEWLTNIVEALMVTQFGIAVYKIAWRK